MKSVVLGTGVGHGVKDGINPARLVLPSSSMPKSIGGKTVQLRVELLLLTPTRDTVGSCQWVSRGSYSIGHSTRIAVYLDIYVHLGIVNRS